MLDSEAINSLLGITESYQAPQIMLEKMLNQQERNKLFISFYKHERDLSYEWFQGYFENEHADRKNKKQDFTPNQISNLMTRLSGKSDSYFEATAGTGGIMINHWIKNKDEDTWYHVEELSDRAIPFLIFNMSIRGMNGVILQGDSISRNMKNVYFIRNMKRQGFSEVIEMPKTDDVKNEFNINKWI